MGIPLKQIKSASSLPPENRSKHAQNPNQTKASKVLGIISKALFVAYVVSAAIINGIIIYLAVLPTKYLTVLLAVSITIGALLGFFTIKNFSNSNFRYTARIACSILSGVLTGIFCLVFIYLNHTMGFMDAIRASGYQIDNYSIIVKDSSPYKSLDDLEDRTIAIYDGDNSYSEAIKKLQQKISFKSKNYGSSISAAGALLNDTTDAIFIKSSLVSVINEIVPEFDIDNLRVIDTIEIRTKVDSATTNLDVTKDSFNIFISGIDTYGEISTVSRSDVNMIITINPRTHTILLTSIPRDYYVQLHGTTGLKDKLTHAGLYGINMSINTLQDLFDIQISYYIRVNFDSTINLINAIDGIDVVPDLTFSRTTDGIYCYYQEGVVNHLDGFCALRYARERKAYGTGDKHRIQNQQQVMMGIIDKLTGSKILLAKYTDILSSMTGTLETNIPSSQIYKLVNEQLDSMPSWTIERISADGEHIDAETFTIPGQYLYVFEPYPESVAEVSAKIKATMEAN